MVKKYIHIVPHTHWDREWYFTSAKSKIYLQNDLKEVLDMLENNDSFSCYVLDGQTALLEDYLKAKPEDKDKIKKFAKSGRLAIGPWYTQTDEMVVGGESIIRNLLYGKIDCDKFGARMNVAYLPDSFGQSAAMPKILKGFGIDKSMFWRGYSKRLGIDKSEFIWQADDGSNVVVQLLPVNYSVGLTLPNTAKEMHKRLDKDLKTLEQYSTNGHLCVPNGHDQMPLQQNIFEIIDIMKQEYPDYEIKLSSYEELYSHIDKSTLKTIKGEFLDGKHMRIHRSIYSSRADLKCLNTQIENKITNVLEPIASIACNLGLEYQTGTIENVWREMLKNHAHDSIGCCNTDKVNEQVKRRFDIANDSVENLTDFYMKKIVNNIDRKNQKLIIFNTLAQTRKDCIEAEITSDIEHFDIQDSKGNIIDYQIISAKDIVTRESFKHKSGNFVKYKIALTDCIPAMGYKIYEIVKSSKKKFEISKTASKTIENKYYKIKINNNGSINITNKNNNITYNNILIFEDSADGGDSYDYSPIKNDYVLKSNNVKANIETFKSKYYEETYVTFRFEIPKNLESRLLKKIDSYIDVSLCIRLEDSPLIKLSIDINNHAKDHRVRALIPQKQSAKNSIADIQFGKIKRNVYDKAIDVWEKENWEERPDPIYPFLSYVYTEPKNSLAAISNSVREYEIISSNNNYDTIAITLFRAYGRQGRPDLLRRPGRASGAHAQTPNAQLIGKNSFNLALTTDLNNIEYLSKYYTTPFTTFSTNLHDDLSLNKDCLDIPKTYSLLQIKKSRIIVSALKKSEKENFLCLRLYNTQNIESKLDIKTILNTCEELMLDESPKKAENNQETIIFKPYEIKTLKLCK